ncbi:hypothetical protein D3C74_497750 [compost metagenome]
MVTLAKRMLGAVTKMYNSEVIRNLKNKLQMKAADPPSTPRIAPTAKPTANI